jgi:hypothetical protein
MSARIAFSIGVFTGIVVTWGAGTMLMVYLSVQDPEKALHARPAVHIEKIEDEQAPEI